MKNQLTFQLMGVISLKDELDDFGDVPVSYNRRFRNTGAEQAKVLEEAPLIKARSAHASYSRSRPVRIVLPVDTAIQAEPATQEEPVALEKDQTLSETLGTSQITIPQRPDEGAESQQPKKTPKKVLRFTKTVRPPREVLDHRRLPGC